MGAIRRNIATIIGVAMVVFVVANVQLGMVAPQIIDGADNSTIDVLKMLEPHCEVTKIEVEKLSEQPVVAEGDSDATEMADADLEKAKDLETADSK